MLPFLSETMGYGTIPYKKQWVCVTKLLLVDPNCLGSNEESFLKIKSLKVPAEKPDILVPLLIHSSRDDNSSGGGKGNPGNSAFFSPQKELARGDRFQCLSSFE